MDPTDPTTPPVERAAAEATAGRVVASGNEPSDGRSARSSAPPAAEKQFYLRELAGRTLLVTVIGERIDVTHSTGVLRELLENDTRLVMVVATPARSALPEAWPTLHAAHAAAVQRSTLRSLWEHLRHEHAVVVTCDPPEAAEVGAAVGSLLRPTKAVLAMPGLSVTGLGSFVQIDTLRARAVELRSREATGDRPRDAATGDAGVTSEEPIRRAVELAVPYTTELLDAGVQSVNLCDPDRVGDELFTYDGAGTLVSPGSYLEVAPLGIDQYAEVEALIDGGVRDGFLRPRDPDEVAQVLFDGFGACISNSGHLAGIVALDSARYAPEPVGELVSLITINRFGGHGVATALVDRVVAAAEQHGLAALFSCTTSQVATEFFVGNGFEPVDQSAIPPTKWAGYDPRRRAGVQVLRRTLDS